MQKRSIEIVFYVKQLEQNFAFTGLFRKRTFLFRASTVVIKFGQQPKAPFTLGSQIFLKSRDIV
jgi:hypothetical protein